MNMKEGNAINISKRNQFEIEFAKTDYFDIEYRAKGVSKPFSWNDVANRYTWHDIQAGWEMWEKSQAVPEGFVLVLKEPNEEMIISGLAVVATGIGKHNIDEEIRKIWQKMIEAQESK